MTQAPEKVIDYVDRFGPNCRDCGDEDGVCPMSGLPCGDRRRGIEFVLGAVSYGRSNGYISWPSIPEAHTVPVKQQAESDCFLASMAMATGLTYEEACAHFNPAFVAAIQKDGTYDAACVKLFNGLGFVEGVNSRRIFIQPEYASAGFVKNMLWGRRACIQVRSKNQVDGMHIVYWDGTALHDPSNLRTYEWAEVEPIIVWLFLETGQC